MAKREYKPHSFWPFRPHPGQDHTFEHVGNGWYLCKCGIYDQDEVAAKK
jgi:hypothetical protein